MTDIQKLSQIEQNLSSIVNQRQSIQKQVLEIDNAISELKDEKEGYQIVGTVMVKKPATEITENLTEKKEMMSVRLQALQKQEQTLRNEAKKIQEKVMKDMENSK